ncbi:MAG: (2Fe-2S)-binding protein [Methanomassiliicoccaceae archaeon]|jgi:NAD(P)H-nitrite reductase large subunit|nr:(2Fe-2S)-binding protein [Methanomassiliicoccaceae archaeon]
MQDEIICYCSNVTRRQIVDAIGNGAKTLQDIRDMTGACTVGRCKELSPKKRCCSGDIVKILNENKNSKNAIDIIPIL